MAFIERYLNGESRWGSGVMLAAFAAFGFFASIVHAQPEAPSAVFRTLAFSADVSEVFYELRGKPVPVTAATAGLSMPYETPAGGRVVFYRLQPAETPEGKPRRVTVTDANLGGPGPFLVFMAARPESPGGIWVQVTEDSWATHPADTIRLFNFSRRNVAVRIVIKDVVAELMSGEDRVLPYVAKGQFWMQAATKEAEGWVMRVSAPQVAPPTARITAIMFDQQPTPDRPVTHELDLVKYIDVAPKPPAP